MLHMHHIYSKLFQIIKIHFIFEKMNHVERSVTSFAPA